MSYKLITKRGRAVAAREAHNLEDAGSNPAPATICHSNILTYKRFNILLITLGYFIFC